MKYKKNITLLMSLSLMSTYAFSLEPICGKNETHIYYGAVSYLQVHLRNAIDNDLKRACIVYFRYTKETNENGENIPLGEDVTSTVKPFKLPITNSIDGKICSDLIHVNPRKIRTIMGCYTDVNGNNARLVSFTVEDKDKDH